MVEPKSRLEDEESEELGREEVKEYRGEAAKLNYLGGDRPDLQYATKEICQGMARPTVEGKGRIKRAARFLAGARRLIWYFREFDGEERPMNLDVCVDSDWAGSTDRKSTSGGVVMWGTHLVKSWSSTQSVVALSSGEAEYCGMVECASVGLGLQSVLKMLTS